MGSSKRGSPATSPKVHRAKTEHHGDANRGIFYHGLTDLVEQNPTAHIADVYAGRERVGAVVQLGRKHYAFAIDEASIGVFDDRRAASRAVTGHPESSRLLAS